MLDIQLDQGDGYTICRPVGELDAFTVSQFRQALAELASSPRLLIDMSGVPFVDSAGLGEIVRCYTTVSRKGGKLKLVNLTTKIRDLLSITKLLTVFDTYETEEQGIKSF